MQQGLRLPMHPFFCEVLKDWNLAPFQITPNGWGQMVASYLLLWKAANPEEEPKRAEVEVGQTFRFKGLPVIRLARPASGEGSLAQASRQEVSGPPLEAQDAAPSSTIPLPRPEVDANVPRRLPSSSNLHIDSTTLRDKGKKVVEGTEEAPSHKRKAPAATEGLMRDVRKARRTEEGRRSSPSLDEEPERSGNSTSSAGQNRRIRISEHHEELPGSVMEMLPAHLSIVVANVHMTFLVAEDSKSKKLAKDLKVMGIEKARLDCDKRAFQFKLDFVVSKETDMKTKYEIELMAAKECLKQARDQRRAVEASQNRAEEAQKLAEEAQKLAEDRTLTAETALTAANSNLEAAAADNERSFTATKLELEKIKAERADAEARAIEAYQDAFVDTPEYQDLAQCLMTVDREQLVERIMEAHPE
ncbi:hypothetical protein Adt_10988 [Abeliophyllum distichum]|uniref:Transposase (putative) gypsy type domain-containing protein n=1 Tax=Abeliophyllum distichum TaxID=126358 RepID=A0ABD1ULL1_9LAMI